MNLISLRAYARSRKERGLTGGSLGAIQKAIAAERISLIEGKIDPAVADIQWDQNTDPAQQKRGAGVGTNTMPTSAAPAVPPSGSQSQSAETPGAGVQTSAPSTDRVSRIREAARADAARAELLEYELEIKRGTLVRADDVRKAAFGKARVARDALMAIPDRLAPLLAAESDPAKVHALLSTELRRLCQELAAGEDSQTRQ